MNTRNIRISALLKTCMVTVAVLVGLLALLSLHNTSQIYTQHHGLYTHPLTVRRAIGDITAGVLTIHRDMKDVVLTPPDSPESGPILENMDQHKAIVFNQIDVLYDRYLGPRSDIDTFRKTFIRWNTVRDETLRIWRSGDSQTAIRRTQRQGEGGTVVVQMLDAMHTISQFSQRRADRFYEDASRLYRTLQLQLGLVGALTLIAAIWLFSIIMRAVSTPLQALTDTTNRVASGELHARCEYHGANEFGALSTAFNRMADAIEHQWTISDLQNTLAQTLLRDEEIHAFSREMLASLMRLTDAEAGACYLVDESRQYLEPIECIGLPRSHRESFSLSEYEGLFGLSLATLAPQRVQRIPEDTRMVLHSAYGAWLPKEVLIIPIVSSGRLEAVISLASLRAFSDKAWDMLRQSTNLLTARVNGVLAHRRIHLFAQQLEHQNRELETQQRLVVNQSREMSEQNRELEMQARQLEEANRLKSAFLSNMSHELRTPLNSVIALSGVLSRRLQGKIGADEFEYLEVIERNGKNLLALINDILDLSRIESGREQITLTVFALSDVLTEITQSVQPMADEKGITVHCVTDPAMPSLYTDYGKVRQILLNLAANAVKFTERGGVKLHSQCEGQTVHIHVQDTGIGIAADQQERIFDEFRQADDGASRRYGGTGLGLSIARRYARLLGGDVTVSSEPGNGSTFTLSLPLHASDDSAMEAGAVPDTSTARYAPCMTHDTPLRLLIVEDNQAAVVQLTDILASEGYQIIACSNGREALDTVKQAAPHGIILDLMMPEIDGFAVLESLKSDPDTRHIPVLILTARQVSREELDRLTANHVFQLVQKGDIDRAGLIRSVRVMTQGEGDTAPRATSNHRAKILIVEDNPDNMQTARALLSDEYVIYEATDGQTCLEIASRERPDVILMDIAMPVMDGVTALLRLRGNPQLRTVPVIAVTASAMLAERDAIMAQDFFDFVAKPIDEAHLLSAIRKALQESRD